MAGFTPSVDLIEHVAAGKVWAIARLISRAEAGLPEVREALGAIYRRSGSAHIIGITGVPGSGKSTLVSILAQKIRDKGHTVAIVAIDPSSPYSGGSILGDRIRMSDLVLDPGVFIRSMATRGAVGGMAHAALDVVDILDVGGYDTIIIETVGVGQDEVEIANASHTTVVVSAPGLGDEVQAIKAGILEIADLHLVSKCDRSDANRTLTDLKLMLKDGFRSNGVSSWLPPVLSLSSVTGEGFDELIASLESHREFCKGGATESRLKRIATFRLSKSAEALVLENFRKSQADSIISGAKIIADRQNDPYTVATTLVKQFQNEANNV